MNYTEFSRLWQQTELPLIAILRGITTKDAVAVADALLAQGFSWLEVPLNGPDALESIALMRARVQTRGFVGAGTVLHPDQVDSVALAGGQLIISPDMNPAVIRRSRERGLISMPGVVTPTEAFAALNAGASALKCFPAELTSPSVLRTMRAVLPRELPCLPVGGIEPDEEQMKIWRAAGANGFGLGGGLYRAGDVVAQVRVRAAAYRLAWEASCRLLDTK